MVRASMKWLYILVLLISFWKKNIYISRLNFTPKIEREKFGKIRPFEKSKKGGFFLCRHLSLSYRQNFIEVSEKMKEQINFD